jgi:thymidine kinase
MSLELYIGPMFAGKSTTLLNIIKRNKFMSIPTFCVTSSLDTRWDNKDISITSHTGEKCAASSTTRLMDLKLHPNYKTAKCIIIEEAQFFSDLKEFVLHAVEVDEKDVVCAGLDGDSLRRPFGQILDLIPYCNSVTKLNAKCAQCKNNGLFTFRKSQANTNQVMVAGADEYEPLCRKHYLENS